MDRKFTLEELAGLTHSELIGDPTYVIQGIGNIESAQETDASFLANSRYESAMEASHAGVIFISKDIKPIPGRNYLINENPSKAFQTVVEEFLGKQEFTGFKDIHPTAVIHETAKLEEGVSVGPRAIIDKNACIGANSTIGAGCYIGPNARIGANCYFHSNVTIREACLIGSNVVIQPGAVIGGCGFGFTTDSRGQHSKLAQMGNVVIEDDVEIGANTTIDRARFGSTFIGKGTKIDNLVMIAHNVRVGRHCIIVAQSGVAGSTEIGNHVVIAGQVAINGHIKIVDGTVISARTGVTKSITKPDTYGGTPAIPMKEHNKFQVFLRTLPKKLEELVSSPKNTEAQRRGDAEGAP